MKRAIRPAMFVLLLTGCLIFPASGQERPELRAMIWEYGSACEFADPPNSSDYEIKTTNERVTLEITDCKAFERKHGHPVAVALTLKNKGDAPLGVPIDRDLARVQVNSGEEAIPALAKRAKVEGPMGGKKMEFITRAEASYLITLAPKQEISILYLFPKAKPGDTLKVADLDPVSIGKSSPKTGQTAP